MNLVVALAVALLLSMICEKAEAQVAREAFYSIPSETMSAADFLMGKKGTPAALAGQLRFAKTGPAKQPVVVLLHSASGPITEGAPYEEWPRVLNEMGIATFAVDSYAGRGLVNYPADPGKISFLTRIIDAYRALEVVAKEPRVDPSRIAVMGFSQGGAAAPQLSIPPWLDSRKCTAAQICSSSGTYLPMPYATRAFAMRRT